MSEQFDLFAGDDGRPEGLSSRDDFISPATEAALVDAIEALPLQPFQFGAFEGKRRIASFGFRYDYTLQRLQPADPVPSWLNDIVAEVEAFGGAGTRIGQILCTEYEIGTGIGWHRDKPHFDRIFGLSLGSACRLRFRRATDKGWQRFALDARPRSLYLMAGPSRQIWEHSISAVPAKRYSITFRTMARQP